MAGILDELSSALDKAKYRSAVDEGLSTNPLYSLLGIQNNRIAGPPAVRSQQPDPRIPGPLAQPSADRFRSQLLGLRHEASRRSPVNRFMEDLSHRVSGGEFGLPAPGGRGGVPIGKFDVPGVGEVDPLNLWSLMIGGGLARGGLKKLLKGVSKKKVKRKGLGGLDDFIDRGVQVDADKVSRLRGLL